MYFVFIFLTPWLFRAQCSNHNQEVFPRFFPRSSIVMIVSLAFISCLLVVVAAQDTEPSVTTSRDPYIYWPYYSSSCDGRSLVGLKGFATLEEIDVRGATADSCASEMACFFDAQSELCASLESNGVNAQVYDAILDDGNLYECDTSNPLTDEDVCEVYDANSCIESSIYPSCQFKVLTMGELRDGNLFANPSDHSQLSDYYYIIWYENDGCTDTVGLAPFVTGENYELPLLDGVSCSDAMACVYSPDGDTCKGRGGGASGTGTFSFDVNPNDDNFVSSCDGTLSDNEGGTCVEETPDQCIPSGVFTGTDCYFRVVPASFLARNPGYLVGKTGVVVEGDGQEGMETSGAFAFSYRYGLALFLIFVFIF